MRKELDPPLRPLQVCLPLMLLLMFGCSSDSVIGKSDGSQGAKDDAASSDAVSSPDQEITCIAPGQPCQELTDCGVWDCRCTSDPQTSLEARYCNPTTKICAASASDICGAPCGGTQGIHASSSYMGCEID